MLTACETGIGREDAGEGVRSLAYSFAYAGCPSMVMSHWKIDERTSSEIIAAFYEQLAAGAAKNAALRAAKLAYLDAADAEMAMPYYWAGLVLVGDVEPVTLAPAKSRGGWWRRVWWCWGSSGGGAAVESAHSFTNRRTRPSLDLSR